MCEAFGEAVSSSKWGLLPEGRNTWGRLKRATPNTKVGNCRQKTPCPPASVGQGVFLLVDDEADVGIFYSASGFLDSLSAGVTTAERTRKEFIWRGIWRERGIAVNVSAIRQGVSFPLFPGRRLPISRSPASPVFAGCSRPALGPLRFVPAGEATRRARRWRDARNANRRRCAPAAPGGWGAG